MQHGGQGASCAGARSSTAQQIVGADAPLADLKSRAIGAVREYTGGPLVHDDVTLLSLEVR